jgi:hypothetical protein
MRKHIRRLLGSLMLLAIVVTPPANVILGVINQT